MGVYITQCTEGGRAYHLVVGTVELLNPCGGLLPFAQLGIAQAGIQFGQVGGIRTAKLVGYLQESGIIGTIAIEGFLKLLTCKKLLSLGQGCAGFLLAGNGVIGVEKDDTRYDCYHCNYANNDGFSVLQKE